MAVDLSVFDNDPTLYLYTSLTAGSSHIITATSRIETILKANKIPFVGVDTAIDERARQLYGRRASGRKLPLLVKQGYVIAVGYPIPNFAEPGVVGVIYGEEHKAQGLALEEL